MSCKPEVPEEEKLGCPPDRSDCFAEDDISGTDCIFIDICFPERINVPKPIEG